MLSRVALVALFVVLALASQRVAMEEDASVPSDWVKGEPANAADLITLYFQLKLRNVEQLEEHALAVSDPDSPRYGKYWSREQVDELTAPTAASFAVVERFLDTFKPAIHHARSSSMIKATMPIGTANKMLGTTLSVYHHPRTGRSFVRTEHYTLPARVAAEVGFVGGLKQFPRAHADFSVKHVQARQQSFSSVDPSVIAKQYGTEGVAAKPASGNNQAVTQFLGQYALTADLDEFFLLFARDALGEKPTYVGYDGWYAGMEASLDIQYIMGVGTKVPTYFWSMPNNNQTNEQPFYDWILQLDNTTTIPILWSVSYGEPEYAVSSSNLQLCSTQFAKLVLRGITVFFASGDSGADCQPSGSAFAPDFPVSSPWVTAVGGTANMANKGEVCNPLSGGGFSNVFGTPSYQRATVEAYLNGTAKKPAAKYFNATGRAYPDVSALSAMFTIVIDLLPQPGIGGTSCASPTTAAVWALLNDLRLAAGKTQLGFLNPLIYKLAGSGSTDITSGSNSGSSEGSACNGVGFLAASGWDPCSGFGSPQYQALATAINALP